MQPQNTEGKIAPPPCASGKHVLGTCSCLRDIPLVSKDDIRHMPDCNEWSKYKAADCPCRQSKAPTSQRAIDISNLRFYSAMAHDLKWQTDTIHWSVISKTLQEIADRLAAE